MAASEIRIGRMSVVEALQVLIDQRRADQIVITNQGSARIWPKLSRHELDFHYNPSTMGGAVPLGLGLAIAQPRREVQVVSGDGALLMNLGSLVSVVAAGVTNLTIVVLDNGLYEVTGGQKTPAANTLLEWPSLARAAGFARADSFGDLSRWQATAAHTLSEPGPRLISLAVHPTPPEFLSFATPPLAEQLARLQRALA